MEQKNTDLRNLILKYSKGLLVDNLDDETIIHDVVDYSLSGLDSLQTCRFDFSTMCDILSCYVMNSNDSKELKERKKEHFIAFVSSVQEYNESRTYLSILVQSLNEMNTEG